jgi:hypothetical protein
MTAQPNKKPGVRPGKSCFDPPKNELAENPNIILDWQWRDASRSKSTQSVRERTFDAKFVK